MTPAYDWLSVQYEVGGQQYQLSIVEQVMGTCHAWLVGTYRYERGAWHFRQATSYPRREDAEKHARMMIGQPA